MARAQTFNRTLFKGGVFLALIRRSVTTRALTSSSRGLG